jgi:hypothetical protein
VTLVAGYRTVDEQIRFAIANKRLIELTYQGKRRVAEPHDYGVRKRVTRLLVYQLRVLSPGERSPTGWRRLDVSQITDCRVLEETFPGSRGAAHAHHHGWDVLYARVG